MDDEQLVRAELVRQEEDARATIRRGIMLLALVPAALLVAVLLAVVTGSVTAAVLALLGAAAYGLIGAIGGLAMIGSGAVEQRRIAKELRAIDEPRQLPEARVVVR